MTEQRQTFSKIVVYHPGAIGDVMLGTPVAYSLKRNFPAAKLIYWTHDSLRELLALSSSIDETVAFDKKVGLLNLRRQLKSMAPDLVIDLSGSTKSLLITALNSGTVLRYKKQDYEARPIMHAVDNYLATLGPLELKHPDKLYPTIAAERYLDTETSFITLVPSVGLARPHRAWPVEYWVSLAHMVLEKTDQGIVLIGGKDDEPICQTLENALRGKVSAEQTSRLKNLCGKLSLVQTASVLGTCKLAVSGDTGPAHIAVATGTKVIGLYGATYPDRSGPYGYLDLVIDRSEDCPCHLAKHCLLLEGRESDNSETTVTSGKETTSAADACTAGKCMQAISPELVFEKIRAQLL